MNSIKTIRNIIAPDAPQFGVVLTLSDQSAEVGVGGDTRNYPLISGLAVGARVVVQGGQLKLAEDINSLSVFDV